ncbi:hypothetical protein BCR43DRAFT_505862 [Syncephalastrum racemosum]|uniref:RRM domain-containing protein n=1 Tax=Syncephalastrum racemosum TaxID=13706 RepID=A0A1X2H9L0_SYNRA|nr:hypothetical protein BCR43DRAFT_505862 [Syncephalastrum racemosum]
MADSEYDIYGDDVLGLDEASEIVGEQEREPKRRKPNPEPPREEKRPAASNHEKRDESSQQQQRSTRQTTPSDHLRQAASQSPSSSSSSTQRIPSSVQAYNTGTRATHVEASPSRRELPQSMASLRGVVNHPMHAFYVGEFPWYVTDEDVKEPIKKAGLEKELKELSFSEHKVNGKSRGICFLEFTSVEAAAQAKEALEKADYDGKRPTVCFTSYNNPFRHTPKEPVPKSQRMQNMRPTNNASPSPANQMMGGFNPMMGGQFNPAFAMNPYAFNPMAAAAAVRGGGNYMGGGFDMMGMQQRPMRGGSTGTGGAGRMGRGGMPSGGGPPTSSGGMYINPAFFEQQQQQQQQQQQHSGGHGSNYGTG